ncbi:MAG: RDD family protein [Acidobacteria bacterium]|nr:RDD family protein [Acidobacteriota bacterium]
MSSNPGTTVIRTSRNPEVIVNFEPSRVAAPFFLRCGALLIDYILVLIAPVGMMIMSRYFGNDGSRLVAGSLNDTGWLIAVLIGVTNFVLLPAFSGRSIGKAITGLTIVGINGKPAGAVKIILRQLLGYGVTIASLGTGFLLSLVNRPGRALHDFLFGTVVIFGQRKYK